MSRWHQRLREIMAEGSDASLGLGQNGQNGQKSLTKSSDASPEICATFGQNGQNGQNPLEMTVPVEWSAGVARLATMPRPGGVTLRLWQRVVEAADYFMEDWATRAAQLGWDTPRCSAAVLSPLRTGST
jgi:hypothetical protein